VYFTLASRLRDALALHIRNAYGIELQIALERPPKIELGEVASPVCFELAKRLKRAPRQIAQEIAAALPPVPGIARLEVAGGGYLNAFFERGQFWANSASDRGAAEVRPGKVIVEHTSINPNKAAHIGHLRNAVLGDTLMRLLRARGCRVQVQNYIDNTGVQVADVVCGFQEMEGKSVEEVRALSGAPKFDYLCWDLYARVTQFFAGNKQRADQLRAETLRSIEEDLGDAAEIGKIVAQAIVACHLRTVARLDIFYDLLARESDILHLHFWNAAFAQLKQSGAIHLAETGKLAGCWVMPLGEGRSKPSAEQEAGAEANEEDEDPQAKVIVRSNGIVTYVGKDIAYQLWKFGLLGKDFLYQRWPDAAVPNSTHSGAGLWMTSSAAADSNAPEFGKATLVYNVIDTRQAYLQDVVAAGLRALDHEEQAGNSIHFDYEVVALTPRCAAELGYQLTPEEQKRPYVEVSGRKGLGVKADDLIDRLEAATLGEVRQRHPEMDADEQTETAHAIAAGALRYFLLKFTRTAIIAFDFKDALSFEGETGPYCQYAVVRIRGIRRKATEQNIAIAPVTEEQAREFLSAPGESDLWELVQLAGSLDYAVEAAVNSQEPAFVAKFAFQLAQAFNNFYHVHHILSEENVAKRAFLLAICERVETQLVRALELLGIAAPEKM
jgi:arginyl-tRNA synthetase